MTEKLTVRPYIGKIAIVDPPATSSESSVILPAGFEILRRGIVVGVGPEVPELSEGNVVWLPNNVGDEIEGMIFVNHTNVIAFSEEM